MTRIFFAAGPPRGKGRARSTRSGIHFTPNETVLYEAHVRDCYIRAYPNAMHITGPLHLTVDAFFDRPKSHFNKAGVKASAPDWHVSRPDLDNILKSILDGLNGIAWADDSAVVAITARKKYTRDSPAGVLVEIETVEE
jgi:Holliday junction resolvase RusA-like endonuclease